MLLNLNGIEVYKSTKSHFTKVMNWKDADYNDLQRHRPYKKANGGSTDPFFLPILQNHKQTHIGQGNKLELSFPDLFLLSILMQLKEAGIDRALGRFIRAAIVFSYTKFELTENIWLSVFNHDSGFQWYFQINFFPEGKRLIRLIREKDNNKEIVDTRIMTPSKDSHVDACSGSHKVTDLAVNPNSSETSFYINLNTIHKRISEILSKNT